MARTRAAPDEAEEDDEAVGIPSRNFTMTRPAT